MEKNAFVLFLRKNRIKQKDIAEYLKVSPQFISSLCKGGRPLPVDKLDLIKANSKWDTTMYAESSVEYDTQSGQQSEDGNDNFQRSILGAISAVEKIAESNRMLAESNHELTITNKILATSNTDLVQKLAEIMDEMRSSRSVKHPLEAKGQIASDVVTPYDNK